MRLRNMEAMMTTVTIQIGNSDDKLTQGEWAKYVSEVDAAVRIGTQVHFFGGSPNWYPWQNACWVIVGDKSVLTDISMELHDIRKKYSQDSIAWTQGETAFI